MALWKHCRKCKNSWQEWVRPEVTSKLDCHPFLERRRISRCSRCSCKLTCQHWDWRMCWRKGLKRNFQHGNIQFWMWQTWRKPVKVMRAKQMQRWCRCWYWGWKANVDQHNPNEQVKWLAGREGVESVENVPQKIRVGRFHLSLRDDNGEWVDETQTQEEQRPNGPWWINCGRGSQIWLHYWRERVLCNTFTIFTYCTLTVLDFLLWCKRLTKSRCLTRLLVQSLVPPKPRNDMMTSWVQKLSTQTTNKPIQGTKVKEDGKWLVKELEMKADLKGLSADLWREEIKPKTQEELVVSNNSKLHWGQLAMDLKEDEQRWLRTAVNRRPCWQMKVMAISSKNRRRCCSNQPPRRRRL